MSSFALIQVVFLNTMGFVLTFVLFLSLLCNFNVAIFFKETLNLFLQTQIGKIKISIYRESFFSSFFSVTKQSICMKQCHLHLPCGYSLIPVKGNFEKQCIWTFGVCMKNQNFFLHQIVNVRLQYLSSLFSYKYDIRTGSTVRPFTLSYITRPSVDEMMVQRQLPRWKMDDRLFLETFLTGN